MIRVSLSLRQQTLLTQLVTGLPVLDPISGPWVAGGSVRAVVVDESLNNVHDVDVWFRDLKQRTEFQARLGELGYQRLQPVKSAAPVYKTQWGKLIQCIVNRYHTTAESVIETFSITACQFITDGHHIWAGDQAIEDARHKQFRVVWAPRLSEEFICKYLNDYGYRYDGNVDDLKIDVGEWYVDHLL